MLSARDRCALLAPPREDCPAAVEALDAWLVAHAPLVKTAGFELASVSDPNCSPDARPSPQGVEVARAGLVVTLRMSLYDPDGAIQDIKEQQLLIVPTPRVGEVERVIGLLEGLTMTLPRAVTSWGERVES